MQVTTDIARSDIIKFNLYFLPRAKANLIFIAVVAVAIFVGMLIIKRQQGVDSIAIAAIASILGGIGGLLGGFAVTLLFILNASNEKNGVLGKHTYIINSEGLRERTCSNDGLQKWNGVQSVGKSASFIFIRINSYMFHVIPHRAFSSLQEFEAFYVEARTLWETAQMVLVDGAA